MTDGLSNRLPLPSLEAMRAGTVNNPVSLMRRWLVAMRSAGLSKEYPQRVEVWLQRQVDALWPLDQTPIAVLREKALRAECEAKIRTLRTLQDESAMAVMDEIQWRSAEMVAKARLLAGLERKLEGLK